MCLAHHEGMEQNRIEGNRIEDKGMEYEGTEQNKMQGNATE